MLWTAPPLSWRDEIAVVVVTSHARCHALSLSSPPSLPSLPQACEWLLQNRPTWEAWIPGSVGDLGKQDYAYIYVIYDLKRPVRSCSWFAQPKKTKKKRRGRGGKKTTTKP